MAKSECETSRAFSTKFLKKHGYLNGYNMCGSIVWTRSGSDNKNSISFDSNVFSENPSIRVHYNQTSYLDKSKTDYDYRIRLVTTPCNYGGVRYWFICPLIRNGVPCNKRVGVLYLPGEYLGCRNCYRLAYQSQNETHSGLFHALGKVLGNHKWSEREEKMRVRYWHGRPTKRYARLQNKMSPSISMQEAAMIEARLHKL